MSGTKRSTKPLDFSIHNVSGIAEFAFRLVPGVNVLLGPNGAGKTSALRAVSRACGAQVPLEVRDGETVGTVEGPGVTLRIGKVVKASGLAEVSLADGGPLADLIDPGIADQKARASARLRALLRLAPMPLTDEVIGTLADADPEITGRAMRRVRDELVTDLLEAAEIVRLESHSAKRNELEQADTATGRAQAHDLHADEAMRKLGGQDRILEDVTPEEAEAQANDLSRLFEATRIKAKARQDLEAQQAEVRESLGEKPDPSRFDDDLQLRSDALAAADQESRDLERRLAQIKERMAGIRQDRDRLLEMRQREEDRLRTWERQAEILERPVEGPKPEDVEAARLRLESARDRVTRARHSADWQRNRAASREAAQQASDHRKRAEQLDALATSVRERLGQLLQSTAAEGLTVVDGRLAARGEDGTVRDFETRLSDGQRIAVSLKVASRAYRGSVVPLDGRYWTALDPVARQHFASEAVAQGLIVLTEQPADGELRVEVAETADGAAA